MSPKLTFARTTLPISASWATSEARRRQRVTQSAIDGRGLARHPTTGNRKYLADKTVGFATAEVGGECGVLARTD